MDAMEKQCFTSRRLPTGVVRGDACTASKIPST